MPAALAAALPAAVSVLPAHLTSRHCSLLPLAVLIQQVVILSTLLADPVNRMSLAREGLLGVLGVMPWLQAYAAAFFAIPAFRWLRQKATNAAIDERNDARRAAVGLLARPDPVLQQKLAGAAAAAKQTVVTSRCVYDGRRGKGQGSGCGWRGLQGAGARGPQHGCRAAAAVLEADGWWPSSHCTPVPHPLPALRGRSALQGRGVQLRSPAGAAACGHGGRQL